MPSTWLLVLLDGRASSQLWVQLRQVAPLHTAQAQPLCRGISCFAIWHPFGAAASTAASLLVCSALLLAVQAAHPAQAPVSAVAACLLGLQHPACNCMAADTSACCRLCPDATERTGVSGGPAARPLTACLPAGRACAPRVERHLLPELLQQHQPPRHLRGAARPVSPHLRSAQPHWDQHKMATAYTSST